MAVTDAYADNVKYKAVFTKTSGDNDTEIDADLLAISRYIERRLGGRFFTQDAGVVARRYYPNVDYQRTLAIDDVATKTGLIVKVDDNRDGIAEVTIAETTDFELLPLNAAFGPEPRPWNQLYIPPRTSRNGWWSMVEVTAKYGWPAIPKAIERATIQLTGILRLESPRATSRIPEAVDAAIDTSPTAQRIVDELLRVYAKPAWAFA